MKKKDINLSSLSIEYRISNNFDDIDEAEPDQLMTRIVAKVTGINEFDEPDDVAKAQFYAVDMESAFNCGYSPFYFLDIEQQTAPYIALYEGYGSEFGFEKKVRSILGEDVFGIPNILIIDRMEIVPEYRGQGLAKRIISEAERLYSVRDGIVVLQAVPLQLLQSDDEKLDEWDQKMQLHLYSKSELEVKKSLSSYYEQLGFEYFKDDIMIKWSDKILELKC